MKTTCFLTLSLLATTVVQAATAAAEDNNHNDICRDEPYYRYQLQEEQGCQWVVDNNSCSQMDNDNEVGAVYCPVSCNSCLEQQQEQQTAVAAVSTKNCYDYGDVIDSYFTNSSPQPDDWIALYADDDNNHNAEDNNNNNLVGNPSAWVWLCGTQDDQCKVSYGSFSFGKNVQSHGQGAKSWPLDPGMYKAVLARRHSGGPYTSYAESKPFEIKEYGAQVSCLEQAQE
jgi:hypothetical protein